MSTERTANKAEDLIEAASDEQLLRLLAAIGAQPDPRRARRHLHLVGAPR